MPIPNIREETRVKNSHEPPAIIWDMDGILADTAPYHLAAWKAAFKKRGYEFTGEDFKGTFGQRNDFIIMDFLGEDVPEKEMADISREKEPLFRDSIRAGLKPLPGAMELIKSLKDNRSPMALASSAPAANIELVIKTLGIENVFQATASDNDVIKGKPDPQVFLLAAERLGVRPESCVVIEDAVAGVKAAKRAGMSCLAVTNTHPAVSLKEADVIVDTLEEVTVNDLKRLIGKPNQY